MKASGLQYLQEKLEQAGIGIFTGSERGTSSRCPLCGNHQKPKGRTWRCKACGFAGHRDLVGSANMHEDNFGIRIEFPEIRNTTYLRPLRRSSRPDTDHGFPKGTALLFRPRNQASRLSPERLAAQDLDLGRQTETHPLQGIGSVINASDNPRPFMGRECHPPAKLPRGGFPS